MNNMNRSSFGNSKAHTCTEMCVQCDVRAENPICSEMSLRPEISRMRRDLKFSPGEVIFSAGEEPRGLYSVRSGLVKIEKYSKSGSAHTMRLYGPGSAFGYPSLFDGGPALGSAVALEETSICLLPKESIKALIAPQPKILLGLFDVLSADLRNAEQKWLNQMDMGAIERVAEALVFLTDHFPDTKWTRREIAQWAGTTPETVIRTLSNFESEGLIDQSDGRSIKLVDRLRLLAKFN